MVFKIKKFYVVISPFVFLSIILLTLKCKLAKMTFGFCALVLHEVGHIITAYALGEQISILKILPIGFSCKLKNQTQISEGKMLKILIAGPAVNFITAGLFLYWTIDFATINFLVGVFNLLPIYELDGMRIFNIVKKWLQIVIFMVKYLVKN